MKILVISNLYPPNVIGGYEVGCAQMVNQLRKMGHQVTVLTARGTSDFAGKNGDDGIRRVLTLWDTFNRNPSGNALNATAFFHGRVIDLTNLSLILEELCSKEYDVVYSFNLDGLGALAICDLLTDLRVPWVWHLMDCIPRIMIHDLRVEIGVLFAAYANRRVSASRTISMSRRLLDEIAEVGISLGNAVTVIPGWAPETETPISLNQSDTLAFASIGVVCPEKGSDLILETLRQLDPAIRDKVSVDFFGRGDIARYRNIAGRFGLSRHVTFHGQVGHDEVMALLPRYDGLLFPTWEREPFGFVALEAAANGVTPVITRGIGAAEVLADQIHSLQIDREPGALADVIVNAVKNPEQFRSVGRNARSHTRSNYLLPFIARQVENELLGVAEPIRISPDLAQRFLDINRYKYRFSQEYIVAFAQDDRDGVADMQLVDSYRRLKQAGRSASKGTLVKLFRSGMMKIMRPYFMEILANQRQVAHRLQSLNNKNDSLDARVEKYLKGKDTDQKPL